MKTNTVYVV